MANFFDPLSEAPVVKFKIPTTGTFTIGLFGGGPVGQTGPGQARNLRLDVTSRYVETWGSPLMRGFNAAASIDLALIRDRDIGSNRRLLTFQISRLSSNRLCALYNDSEYCPSVTFERDDVKKSIVSLARMYIPTAHYLWGTAGNRPGKSDGNPGGGKADSAVFRKPPSLDITKKPAEAEKPDLVLGLAMATTEIDGHNTCAGRSGKYNYTGNLTAYIDRANKLAASKNGIANVLPGDWEGEGPDELHPRRYYFNKKLQGDIVWGESCDDLRHFDCVGLINFCYAYHLDIPDPRYHNFGGDIAWWAKSDNQMCKEITNPNDVEDADVVIRKNGKDEMSHIAMVYLDGSTPKIVQPRARRSG